MVLLLTRTRFARWALGVLAAIPILDIVFFHAGDLYTGVWAAAFAAVLGLAAWKLKSRWLAFLQIFLGVEVGLNAFRDLMTLIFISGQGLGMGTDADQMSHALFFPSIFWSVLWSIISILMLSTGIYVVVRRDFPQLLMRRRSGEKSGPPRDT
jgi:Peptidase M50B-like